LERRVGALVHPGEQRAEHKGEERRAGRELERVPEQQPGLLRGVGFAVVAEGEPRRLGRALRREEALPEEKGERHHAEVQRERDAGADDQPLESEARRPECTDPGEPRPACRLQPSSSVLPFLYRERWSAFWNRAEFYCHRQTGKRGSWLKTSDLIVTGTVQE